MTEKTHGLALDPDGDDFVLRRDNPDGTVSELRLSADDVLTLSQSAPLFRERILARRNPATGGVEAVLVTPVAQFRATPDSLGVDILLTLAFANGAQLTYSLSPRVASLLAKHLAEELVKMSAAKPTTRQ
jgi:hypothetical protein